MRAASDADLLGRDTYSYTTRTKSYDHVALNIVTADGVLMDASPDFMMHGQTSLSLFLEQYLGLREWAPIIGSQAGPAQDKGTTTTAMQRGQG